MRDRITIDLAGGRLKTPLFPTTIQSVQMFLNPI